MDLLVIIIGLLVGSFLNVCIYRIPRKESIVWPGSRCTACNTRLTPLDLVPVLSFIFLKGRCRYCKQPIAWRYPAVELLTALLFWLVYRRYGMEPVTAYYLILTCILIVTSAIDMEHQIIPNGLVLTGITAGIVFNLAGVGISFMDGLYGLILGGGSLALVALVSLFVFRREGIGGGDIKLMAAIGLYLGWRLTALALLLSVYIGGMIGLLLLIMKIKKRGDYIAYGPFLAIASLIAILYGESIIDWYLSSFW
ncbi:MAG: prepilin peptidase [Clostridiales bacterium]|jgi:leader peptidase (prepilin peptidase)/N-methyltransferase|nr:prepilin peptidase [Clostridiales bacterium]